MARKRLHCKCGKRKHRSKNGKLYFQCKSCRNVRHSAYVAQNKEKHAIYVRKSYLKYNYGLSLEDFQNLLDSQNGCCAICARPLVLGVAGSALQASIDHDHKTERVRGILCSECNVALGMFHDSIASLQSAIGYLQ